MEDSNEDYNTFKQYSYNHDVYLKFRGDIGDLYDSFPNDILEGQTENNDLITKDCLRIKKFLMKFNSKDDCKNQNCCQYINYTLNKTARMYNDSKESIFDIYIKYVNHHNNNNEIMNFCSTKINCMPPEKYQKIRMLYTAYGVCQSYISNKDRITSCNHVELCAKAYKNIITEYTKRNDTKFCKNLKDLKILLEENEPISTHYCDLRFSALLSYPSECDELLKEAEKTNAPVDQKTGKLDEQEKLQKEVTGAAEVKQREGILGVRLPRIDAPGEGISGVGVPGVGIDIKALDTLQHKQFGAEEINGNPPNTNIPIPIGTIIYTSLGSVLPLVTLYKYTPLGPWINTRILGRNKLMENMKKNNYELLLNDVGNHESSLNDPMYHIRYNSETNH
ncbi:PIR protein [Plasmodium vivax]|uniref:VIR protein n=1 Tax=Plasmodium vivax TaxID=5855 RepID=A0A564ZSJ1_PLAVI|nr:PIR protein [Plasmodium vivax]